MMKHELLKQLFKYNKYNGFIGVQNKIIALWHITSIINMEPAFYSTPILQFHYQMEYSVITHNHHENIL